MPPASFLPGRGCRPIVRAFEKGERFAGLFPGCQTVAGGLRVPAAIGDFMILDDPRPAANGTTVGIENRRMDGSRGSTEGTHLPRHA